MPGAGGTTRVAARALRSAWRAPSGPLLAGVDAIDAASLAALLGRPVDAVEVLATTEGTTDRAHVRLEGEGLPATAFVKLPPAKRPTRVMGELAGLGRNEVRFYRDVAPSVPVRTPTALAAAHDPASGQWALVLQDLGERDATFFDTTSALTPDQAAAVLDQLAVLHGRGAGAIAGGLDLSWASTVATDPMLPLVQLSLRGMRRRVEGHAGGPDAVGGEAGHRVLRHYRTIAAELDEGPQTVLHGDCHPGNLYLDGPDVSAGAGLFDFQVLRRGNPLRDVAYFLTLSLAPEDRRTHERDLVEHHRAALAAHGGPALDADTAWRYHRRSVAYAFVAAYFVAGVDGLQSDDVRDSGLARASAALTDLDTVGALTTLPA